MSDTEESVEVAQGLLVNIFIRLPAHTQLEPMAERLRSMLDMEEPKVQSIISRLKSMPIIQIGARVRKSAADRAAADFQRVGFLVDLRPVLSLEAKSDTQVDGNAYECPSCEAKVVLTEQGQENCHGRAHPCPGPGAQGCRIARTQAKKPYRGAFARTDSPGN